MALEFRQDPLTGDVMIRNTGDGGPGGTVVATATEWETFTATLGAPRLERPLEMLAELRRHVSGLLACIDTSGRPVPDHVNPADHRLPGPVWHPAPGWTVRVIDNDPMPDVVHVSTPDAMHPSDFAAARISAARRIAMALLAACDHADARLAGVTFIGGPDATEHGDCGRACPP
ncbi:hypothetical protein ACFFMN_23550 [Planobispora siamensis]|uniref:Uncharacterized protein n=1 Tax=Planobispora siamensis TaxID=936338 RepID=A0A8J3SLG5_9ACTN|nr:hypothetical protein [Planobispora siamensis]GIH95340.1 hypothetical protein Psi01_59700 [Planobispora siamensis]